MKDNIKNLRTNVGIQGEIKMSTSELLKKFPNGEERFQKDPLFHHVIQTLVRGGDPYQVIDQLIESQHKQLKSFGETLLGQQNKLRKP